MKTLAPIFALTFCVGLIFTTKFAAGEETDFAFVSVADENSVYVYRLTEKNQATLKLLSKCSVNGDAGSQYFDKKRDMLFLGLRNAGKIVSLKLDRKNGTLKQIDEIKVDKDPAYMTFDASGRWLLVAFYATGRLLSMEVDRDGKFSREQANWIESDRCAHAIAFDATNRFLFVPHTCPNVLFQFRFDVSTGKIIPNASPKLEFETKLGPRHLVRSPTSAKFFYSSNEQGSSVTQFQFDAGQGTLKPVKTLSTLPDGYSKTNHCSDIEFSRNGKFLYVANRGHDSIAVYSVNSSNAWKRIQIAKTEKTPRQFALSHSNRTLIAAGQGTDRLAIYTVDSQSGRLELKNTITTGKKPWWISICD